MPQQDAAKESEMIVRQISWLRVYCLELNLLEQPGMPKERHQEVMALRREAPQFFCLVRGILKDALILGLDNILDTSKNGKWLTIEHVVDGLTDLNTKKQCEEALRKIRKSDCYRAVKIARNHLISHPDRDTLLQYEKISEEGEDKRKHVNYRKDLSIPCLEALLRQLTDLAGIALGKLPSEFWVPDWEGVSQLFNRLRALP